MIRLITVSEVERYRRTDCMDDNKLYLCITALCVASRSKKRTIRKNALRKGIPLSFPLPNKVNPIAEKQTFRPSAVSRVHPNRSSFQNYLHVDYKFIIT